MIRHRFNTVRVTGQCHAVRPYGMKMVTHFRYVCDFLIIYTKNIRVPDVTRYAKVRYAVRMYGIQRHHPYSEHLYSEHTLV